jgi:tRNA (guanine-N7-)-methyltransferase
MACSSDFPSAATAASDSNRRRIRSFVLRQGRLTSAQRRALESHWPAYGIDYQPVMLDLVQVFGNSAPVTLEIGFGNGDSLLQQAMRSPERNYLGIEVHRPGVGQLLHRAAEAGVHNLRVINHDAVEVLREMIPRDSLDCVQLFFPDPWHKRRHHKRRIVQPEFAQSIRGLLRQGGTFHMATDWLDYAMHMLAVMEQSEGFTNAAGAGQFATAQTRRPETRFEHRGRRLGHEVRDLVFVRRT